jgi:hypothetical protein
MLFVEGFAPNVGGATARNDQLPQPNVSIIRAPPHLDETSKQLIIETRAPIPPKSGRKARHDYEYERTP